MLVIIPQSPPATLGADAVTTGGGEEVAGSVRVATGNEALVSVMPVGAAVAVPVSPPVIVGTAYGGSNRPNRPQALHGYAHELTCLGAARIGSHRESTMVAIAEGSAV